MGGGHAQQLGVAGLSVWGEREEAAKVRFDLVLSGFALVNWTDVGFVVRLVKASLFSSGTCELCDFQQIPIAEFALPNCKSRCGT